MKVLMINGSPHARGSTYTALHYVEQELNQQGVETEIFHIGSAPVQGCTGCRVCRSSSPRRCVFDDSVNLCAEKIAQSDGLVIGSPVHYSGIAGGMKAFCDRLFYLAPRSPIQTSGGSERAEAFRRSGYLRSAESLLDLYRGFYRHFTLLECGPWGVS